MSKPQTSTVPEVGFAMRAIARSSVDLPAPLRPSKTMKSPERTVRVIPSKATVRPNHFSTFSIWTTALGLRSMNTFPRSSCLVGVAGSLTQGIKYGQYKKNTKSPQDNFFLFKNWIGKTNHLHLRLAAFALTARIITLGNLRSFPNDLDVEKFSFSNTFHLVHSCLGARVFPGRLDTIARDLKVSGQNQNSSGAGSIKKTMLQFPLA